jgi:recombinational DNA repair protein RecR
MNMTEIPLLTFDKLFDLVEENRFVNETNRKIAEKILEAENDWGDWKTSVKNLNEFIIALEKEVGGTATKTSLNKLLKKYNRNIAQNAWKAETVCSLLEIFELTKETELRKIFNNLTEKQRLNEKP